MLPISETGLYSILIDLYSHSRLKVSHAPQSGMRTVLVKEKPANAKSADEPQQYIEVCREWREGVKREGREGREGGRE